MHIQKMLIKILPFNSNPSYFLIGRIFYCLGKYTFLDNKIEVGPSRSSFSVFITHIVVCWDKEFIFIMPKEG